MSWNFVEHFSLLGTVTVGFIVPFLFVLTIIVFFHELGHFLIARWCGIKVLAFSIGFGPEIVGFNDRRGTRWKISAIPLGGYVKFLGDDSVASNPDQDALATMSEEDRRVSFFHQPVAKRMAVVVAGPIANFVLAIAIFAVLFMTFGKQDITARVGGVEENSAAAAAGFQPGDLVLSINGQRIDSFLDMKTIVSMDAGVPLDVVVERAGAQVTLHATPRLTKEKDVFGEVHSVGLLGVRPSTAPEDLRSTKFSPPGAVWEATRQIWFVVDQTFAYISKLLVGHASTDEIGGVIRIAKLSGEAASMGFSSLMNLAAVISVSIGLLNLFPIPLLDGGHLLFYAIEAVRGRPVSERIQEFGYRIGLAIIVMLMIFTVWNDLAHFGAS
ncbi:MAG TPA: RIP metalloprotease RseP [Xanthobacteraceae bacterium]|nr:RIP metalloprotease RseP [Xanthobacteraceae bacterium]